MTRLMVIASEVVNVALSIARTSGAEAKQVDAWVRDIQARLERK
jgi:hypothetical protein